MSAGAKGRRRARRIAIAAGLPDPKAVQRYQETRRRRLRQAIHLSACGLLLTTRPWWLWWKRGKHEKQDMESNPDQWRDIIGRR